MTTSEPAPPSRPVTGESPAPDESPAPEVTTPLIQARVVVRKPDYSWQVECDRHGVISTHYSRDDAQRTADGHSHCPCPDVGGSEVGEYLVDLCHERGVHDPEVIWPLVNAAREDALGLCEQIVAEAFGPAEPHPDVMAPTAQTVADGADGAANAKGGLSAVAPGTTNHPDLVTHHEET